MTFNWLLVIINKFNFDLFYILKLQNFLTWKFQGPVYVLCSTCRPSNFCLFLCVITFPKQLTCKITVKGAFRLNVQRDYFCIKRCQLLTTSEIVNIREHKMPSRRFFKVNSCKKFYFFEFVDVFFQLASTRDLVQFVQIVVTSQTAAGGPGPGNKQVVFFTIG